MQTPQPRNPWDSELTDSRSRPPQHTGDAAWEARPLITFAGRRLVQYDDIVLREGRMRCQVLDVTDIPVWTIPYRYTESVWVYADEGQYGLVVVDGDGHAWNRQVRFQELHFDVQPADGRGE